MPTPPKVRSVPITQDPNLQGFLNDVKLAIDHAQSATAPPLPPTNFTATPIAGGVAIGFTRSNATNFRLYSGPTPNRSDATLTDLGSNNQYTDSQGQGGVLRYYWIEAISPTNSSPSQVVGPISATTLALGTPATVVPPPQPSYQTVFDATLGRTRPVVYGTDFLPQQKGRS